MKQNKRGPLTSSSKRLRPSVVWQVKTLSERGGVTPSVAMMWAWRRRGRDRKCGGCGLFWGTGGVEAFSLINQWEGTRKEKISVGCKCCFTPLLVCFFKPAKWMNTYAVAAPICFILKWFTVFHFTSQTKICAWCQSSPLLGVSHSHHPWSAING